MELDIALNPALADFFRQFEESSPTRQFEYVDHTFGTADADRDIRTILRPTNPDDLDYVLVRADRSTNIYHDQSATRKVWGKGYVILRSSAANAVCKILLTVRRD